MEPLREVLNFEQKGFTLANTSVILWVCRGGGEGSAEEDDFDLISLTDSTLFTKFPPKLAKWGEKGEKVTANNYFCILRR